MKKWQRISWIAVCMAVILFMAYTSIGSYYIKPSEVYLIQENNFISDGSFEDAKYTAGDCCNTRPGQAKVSASSSKDFTEGNQSLALSSSNHCACYNTKLTVDNSYKHLFSIDYKGDNPKICLYDTIKNKCDPLLTLNPTSSWKDYSLIIDSSAQKQDYLIYLYTDSDGSKTNTNLYDNMQMKQLQVLSEKDGFEAQSKYLIKTDPINRVKGDLIAQSSQSAYYIVVGKPLISLKFPLHELILIIGIMLVLIRILYGPMRSNSS